MAGFGDGEVEFLGVPCVVPVQELSLRESGDEAADARGEEDEADLEVVEAVDFGK